MIEKSISDIIDEHERTDLYMSIIEALSKQIAQKVKTNDQVFTGGRFYLTTKTHHCPSCDETVHNDLRHNHCSNCGQRLDWRTVL